LVSRNESDGKTEDVKYFASGKYTVTFSSNDTWTASDYTDTEALKFVAIIKNLDGTELTNSVSDNIVTCTQSAITDAECTVFVFGVRA
jgi:hypothetical protein